MKNNLKVLLNACTHGDEKIGLIVSERIKKLKVVSGDIDYQIANPEALEKGVRYIDSDLNRSFPGDPNGNSEEKRAVELVKKIRKYDCVLDFHSTTSSLRDTVVLVNYNEETKKLAIASQAKNVLVMKATSGKDLLSFTKLGIATEFGSDYDPEIIDLTYNACVGILNYLGVIEEKPYERGVQPNFYEVYGSCPKPESATLEESVENFKEIETGDVYAHTSDGDIIVAKEDFVPILFGEKNYEHIFGFKGRKIEYLVSNF